MSKVLSAPAEGTFQMQNSARSSKVTVSADGRGLVSQAGAVLLWETLRVTGLGRGLSAGPGAGGGRRGRCTTRARSSRTWPRRWRWAGTAWPISRCCASSRSWPGRWRRTRWCPGWSATLAADGPRALEAIRAARAAARERAWALAGDAAPGADGGPVIIDLDATIVIAHSEKEQAAPTWKKTFGHHPMTAWADHGAGRERGAAGHRAPGRQRRLEHRRRPHRGGPARARAAARASCGRKVLVRADSGGGTHEFLDLADREAPAAALLRRHDHHRGHRTTAIGKVPADAWTPAYDGDGQVRDGAWVADITGLLDLDGWPAGMRVIVRKERPHPGAQLRFTDIDGHRFTAFATDTKKRPARRPGTAAPAAGPVRGPDPLRQGHRAAEPAAARASPRTRSGARSSRWPASCWPGPRCSP